MGKRALLVGLGEVYNKEINGYEKLDYSAKNVDRIHRRLKREEWKRVTVMLEEEATRANILQELENFLTISGDHDWVLFYFCGHGGKSITEGEEEEGQTDKLDEFIVTYTSLLKIRSPSNYNYFVTDNDFSELLNKYLSRNEKMNFVSMFDCCFAKGMADKNILSFPNHLFFAASDETNYAWSDNTGDSFFNRAILNNARKNSKIGGFVKGIKQELSSIQSAFISVNQDYHDLDLFF